MWSRVQYADIKAALPKYIMDMMVKTQLVWADELQEEYRRNDKEVDKETRTAIAENMKRRRGMTLTSEQEKLFKRCMGLVEGYASQDDADWKKLPTKYEAVDMHMKYFPPRKGERHCATGRAVGVADSSAEELAAYFFDYCSNARMDKSVEEGNKARLVLKSTTEPNEVIGATMKKMPFPLKDRDYTAKR